ncbi:MAG: toll/interleukin-1 receptor domain-containing protein [Acidobacteriota bacterium]
MPECFISYSNQDESLAGLVHSELSRHGITAFMASASLVPGQHWSPEVLNNLRSSEWVILLASRAACSSVFVNQEIGGALLASKKLVPIVWDMSPTELPGWAREIQAVDLRGSTMIELQNQVSAIAGRIRQEKTRGLLILGGIILAFFAFGSDN